MNQPQKTRTIQLRTNSFKALCRLICETFRVSNSSNLPGVAIMMLAPWTWIRLTSSATGFPPTSNTEENCVTLCRNFDKTSWVCEANSRVGDIMRPPTWCFFKVSDLFYEQKSESWKVLLFLECACAFCERNIYTSNISINGTKNAIVLPLPVTASATTSLFFNRYGIHSTWEQSKGVKR